jgi:hypothetical protein
MRPGHDEFAAQRRAWQGIVPPPAFREDGRDREAERAAWELRAAWIAMPVPETPRIRGRPLAWSTPALWAAASLVLMGWLAFRPTAPPAPAETAPPRSPRDPAIGLSGALVLEASPERLEVQAHGLRLVLVAVTGNPD